MNFIFVSPQFPHTYWEFCHRLKQNGVTVLGIGDTPYESLSNELKGSLDDWYYVPNMEDYDRMYRAVAFLASKWGRIDWIESNSSAPTSTSGPAFRPTTSTPSRKRAR